MADSFGGFLFPKKKKSYHFNAYFCSPNFLFFIFFKKKKKHTDTHTNGERCRPHPSTAKGPGAVGNQQWGTKSGSCSHPFGVAALSYRLLIAYIAILSIKSKKNKKKINEFKIKFKTNRINYNCAIAQ
jgi:hypothetical protein